MVVYGHAFHSKKGYALLMRTIPIVLTCVSLFYIISTSVALVVIKCGGASPSNCLAIGTPLLEQLNSGIQSQLKVYIEVCMSQKLSI